MPAEWAKMRGIDLRMSLATRFRGDFMSVIKDIEEDGQVILVDGPPAARAGLDQLWMYTFEAGPAELENSCATTQKNKHNEKTALRRFASDD